MERFHRLEAVRDVLHRLNDGASVPAIRITTAPGWMEVAEHIGTGQSNRGRVYYKLQDGGRLLVVVHFKGDAAEQQRFFKKLNDPRFLQVQSFDAA
jgi:hypothetical protein